MKELTHDPGIGHRQLRPNSIGLHLCGGEGDLGGAQGDLQATALTRRLRVVIHCRITLTEITAGVISIVGVGRIIGRS